MLWCHLQTLLKHHWSYCAVGEYEHTWLKYSDLAAAAECSEVGLDCDHPSGGGRLYGHCGKIRNPASLCHWDDWDKPKEVHYWACWRGREGKLLDLAMDERYEIGLKTLMKGATWGGGETSPSKPQTPSINGATTLQIQHLYNIVHHNQYQVHQCQPVSFWSALFFLPFLLTGRERCSLKGTVPIYTDNKIK